MRNLWQDLRFAVRVLAKNPGFTAVAVITLALGIGATTAIFSVVYGVLLRPLPYSGADRIMAISEVNSNGGRMHLADPNFDDFRDQSRSFQAIAKYNVDTASVAGGLQPARTTVSGVSPDFFRVFRVRPIIGREFNASDNRKGAAPVALVSYGYWKQYLASSTDLSQWHLKIDNALFSVIGVLPDGFRFPSDAALWLPADLDGENPSRTSHNYMAVARLRDGIGVEQANAEISGIARRIHDTSSEQNDYLLKDALVVPLQDSITGNARPELLASSWSGGVPSVGCLRKRGQPAARASLDQRAGTRIRSALGAPRGINSSISYRSVSPCAGSCGLGVLGAFSGVAGLVAFAPQNLPRLESVSINTPVLVFALLLCTAVAIGIRKCLPPSVERRATCAKASGKAGADRRVRKAASALDGELWRHRSPSRWFSWWELDCSGAA